VAEQKKLAAIEQAEQMVAGFKLSRDAMAKPSNAAIGSQC